MSEQTATIASLCVSTLQSLIVFAANFLTIAVFWIHRNKLRRTYLLLSGAPPEREARVWTELHS